MDHKVKPKACEGCPLYDNNDEFFRDSIPPKSKLLVVWDIPSAQTAKHGVGQSGQEKMVRVNAQKYAKLEWDEVAFAHLLRCRYWSAARGKTPAKPTAQPPKGKVLKQAIQHCRIHDRDPDHIQVHVALGALGWKVLTDNIGPRSKWLGYFHERENDAVAANEEQTHDYIRGNVPDHIIDEYFPGLTDADPGDDDESDSDA